MKIKWLNQLVRFFQKRTKVAPEPEEYTLETYRAAGVIFTDGVHVLAGHQPNKKTPFISGIGGSKHKGETYLHTAIRETIEELLEIHKFPYKLMYDIIHNIKPKKVIINTTYVCVIFTFEQLVYILTAVNKYNLVSPIYDTLPTSLMELIFHRKIRKASEISHLVILPAIDDICIDEHLKSDFKLVEFKNIQELLVTA